MQGQQLCTPEGKIVHSGEPLMCCLLWCAGASWGAFSTASYISQGGEFPGKLAVEFVAYFLGIYFASGVFFDAFALGLTAYAGLQYSTNTEAFMAAVRQVCAL